MNNRSELIKLKNNRLLVAIYTNKDDPNLFNAGYIVAIGKNEFVIHSIDEDGRWDGLMTIRIDDITKIEYDSRYLKRLGYINRVMCKKDVLRIPKNINSSKQILKYAKNNNLIVAVWTENEELSTNCFVMNIGKDFLTLNPVNSDGETDGVIMISVESVIAAQVYGRDQILYKLLHDNYTSVFAS